MPQYPLKGLIYIKRRCSVPNQKPKKIFLFALFPKKELKDLSNIAPPTVTNIDYLGERSEAQVCAMFPNLKTTGYILNDNCT